MKSIQGIVEEVVEEEKFSAIFMNGQRYSTPKTAMKMPEPEQEIVIRYTIGQFKGKEVYDLEHWDFVADTITQKKLSKQADDTKMRMKHRDIMLECFQDSTKLLLDIGSKSTTAAHLMNVSDVAIAFFNKRASHVFHMKNGDEKHE